MKLTEQTYVEFSREKQILFELWWLSQKVGSNFHNLKQIILIEDFKNCIHLEIRTHLDAQKVENLEMTTIAADDNTLTHKVSFIKQRYSNSHSFRGRPDNSRVTLGSNQLYQSKWKSLTKISELKRKSDPMCNYCKIKGQVKSECWVLQIKKLNFDRPNPSVLTSAQVFLKHVWKQPIKSWI